MHFDDFFRAARDTSDAPFDYQCRLACGERKSNQTREDWLTHGVECNSKLIAIPTGLGKTAAVVLAWLWNRLAPQIRNQKSGIRNPVWPRRLVYCLPMRTLVEQTAREVTRWFRNLHAEAQSLGLDADATEQLAWLAKNSPSILMGGEDPDPLKAEWDLYPERPAILIGTQDMLLSRALNRGYGMSRYRWPMHFGLLSNDCLWVMDETQLMGVGLETSAQLHGLRQLLSSAPASCPTWWMSATLDDTRLATVDHPRPEYGWPCLRLESTDLNLPAVKDRFEVSKPVAPAPDALAADSKKSYASQLASFILKQHQADSLTLVMLNRVDRAQEVYQELKKLKPTAPLALIHSRFRPADRKRHEAILHGAGTRIVIATQAVEAGVDVSARTLITELAPWPALVQRFGRCNRRGELKDGEARVFWVDLRLKADTDDLALPYTAQELTAARKLMETLSDAGPAALKIVPTPLEPPAIRPVLRRKDLMELFDTTPDLAGHDLDISRYIRDGDDTDVQVFWRDLNGEPPSAAEPQPARSELCRVSLPRFRDFLGKLAKSEAKTGADRTLVVAWNPLSEEWQAVTTARAGGTYLLDVRAGGYSAELGWVGPAKLDTPVTPLPPLDAPASPGYGTDSATFARAWVTLADHTRDVADETAKLAYHLAPDLAPAFLAAAQWHDVGKAHDVFQKLLRGDDPSRAAVLWAKSARGGGRCERRYFRHELASALAWLQAAPPDVPERDLVAYLIAAHHGKVRLSIRSFPGEEPPLDRPEARIARGILDGDPLGPFEIEGVSLPEIRLDLSLMELGCDAQGRPSWLARTIALRERLGPFRLAWLEAILRAADARASALAKPAYSGQILSHDAAGTDSGVEKTPAGNAPPPDVGERAGGCLSQHADGGRAGESRVAAGDTRPPGATRYLDTVFGPVAYTDVAERLALKAVEVRRAIIAGGYAPVPLDERLVATLHRDLCGHLVPGWAGQWRITEVTVGSHNPPLHFQVPLQIRDYAADLQARWTFLQGTDEALLLETLAFAEGRLLSIHPFQDFNGRVTRLFLLEILRRAELPVVRVAVRDDAEKARYFAALQAGDRLDWQPLMALWRERFNEAANQPLQP